MLEIDDYNGKSYRVSQKKWCIAISNSPVVLDVQIFKCRVVMDDQAMMIMTILNILSLKLILKIFKIILTLPPNK